MQQFLLFCTMLIITSEAFSGELHGSQIFKSTARKTRLVPKPRSHNPDMFGNLKFPMFPVLSAHKRPDYKAPFFASKRRRRFKHKNYYKELNMRKRFRKKIFNQRKRNPSSLIKPNSFVLNSPQCFATSRLLYPGCRVGLQNNFTNFSPDVNDVNIENPNQFIVCFYPVFNQFKKRTLNPKKRRKISPFKRQCSTDVKYRVFKNKRSARTKSSFNELDVKKVTRSENGHESLFENQSKFHGNFCENHCENLHENCHKNLAPSRLIMTTPVNHNFSKAENETSPEKEKKKSIENELHEDNNKTDKLVSDTHPKYNNINLNPIKKLKDFKPSFSSDSESNLEVNKSPRPSPNVTVKYHNDVNFYESSLRKEDDFTPPPFNKEISSAVDDSFYDEDIETPYNITKLKIMLNDVESLLGKNDRANIYSLHGAEGPKKAPKNNDTATVSKDADDVKKKIDAVALPMLQELSQGLENISSLISTISAEKKPKKKFFAKLKKKFTPKSKLKAPEKEDQTIEHCIADGTWRSKVYGFELSFKTMPNLMLKVQVTSSPDSVISNKWSIHGLSLSKQGGPFMLGAVYPQKRKLASFIGQCKICKKQQLIFGVWTIYTCGRRFTDMWRGVETKLDILKKNS